jgi:hypothetical protein
MRCRRGGDPSVAARVVRTTVPLTPAVYDRFMIGIIIFHAALPNTIPRMMFERNDFRVLWYSVPDVVLE